MDIYVNPQLNFQLCDGKTIVSWTLYPIAYTMFVI